ncbi:MAG: N-acetyl-gamma-glutamyl-phosphate reductase [Deltaproteobacteria bacterium]|nr:N-acetyl-gamma-glutamyl-phosphate reductase [Deltaproteobacteria bacterium]
MLSVGIIGASGYTGAELLRLLYNHPQARVDLITSRKYAGKPLGECFPSLGGWDLTFESHEDEAVLARTDVVFTALPHQTSMDVVPRLLERGKRVIDLSADFRFNDAAVYEAHYGPHACPELLAEAVYGLTEVRGAEVARARLVGNPGCYPTSVLLPLLPLLLEKAVCPEGLIADSKSGVSGAGREASLGTLYCEVNEGFKAYKVGGHRHTPEMEAQLSRTASAPVRLLFTPHLVPMDRGILSTIYAVPCEGVTAQRVAEIWREFYRDAAFVRVGKGDALASTAYVRGTNGCVLGAVDQAERGRIVLLSAIDNLVKGASGQAVQNMNRMMGWDEDLGLRAMPLFP